MQRYFIKESQIKNNLITIDESDSHHIKNVMRMREGEHVIVCSLDEEENSKNYLCTISSLGKNVILNIQEELNENNELDFNVTIAHGLVKRDKQEEVVRRLVELGAYAYLPVIMQRSVIKIDASKRQFKNERFERIVKEASEQSERNRLMKLLDIVTVKELINSFDNYDLVLFASVASKNDLSLKEKMKVTSAKNILVIVGPEGGFSEKEIEIIEATSAQTMSFGKRVLRTETAPLYAMSVLAYEGEK